MLTIRRAISHRPRRTSRRPAYVSNPPGRHLLTLAIETSCDDTCVATLETHTKDAAETGNAPISHATLHFEKRITASDEYKGIHPILALESHHRNLACLVREALSCPPFAASRSCDSTAGSGARKPDLVCVTRGPGMRTNLGVGLEMAKGLSTAWNVPLIGVHHMQAHLLTPALVAALAPAGGIPRPQYPFLSLLVSGGHTLLVSSTSVTHHSIVASSTDLAVGNMIDRAARLILPADSPSFRGPALERFAWPDREYLHQYAPPGRGRATDTYRSSYGWAIRPPLIGGRDGKASRRTNFSFSGLLTNIERAMTRVPDPSTGLPTKVERDIESIGAPERRQLARHAQMIAFEHLLSRVLLHIDSLGVEERRRITSLVVAGGVAANGFLRHVLRSGLDASRNEHIRLCVPPADLCTDNAAMIAWAGTEMWNQGWRSGADILPVKEWSLDGDLDRGGVLGVDGWIRRWDDVLT